LREKRVVGYQFERVNRYTILLHTTVFDEDEIKLGGTVSSQKLRASEKLI